MLTKKLVVTNCQDDFMSSVSKSLLRLWRHRVCEALGEEVDQFNSSYANIVADVNTLIEKDLAEVTEHGGGNAYTVIFSTPENWGMKRYSNCDRTCLFLVRVNNLCSDEAEMLNIVSINLFT